ncbi:hypothetical protein D3C72_1280500 [compost metagenome]
MSTAAMPRRHARAAKDWRACRRIRWARRRIPWVCVPASGGRWPRAWAARPSAPPWRQRSAESSGHCRDRRRNTAWPRRSRCRPRAGPAPDRRRAPRSSMGCRGCAPRPWAGRSSRTSRARSRGRRNWWRQAPATAFARQAAHPAPSCHRAEAHAHGTRTLARLHAPDGPAPPAARAAARPTPAQPARGCAAAYKRSRRRSAAC